MLDGSFFWNKYWQQSHLDPSCARQALRRSQKPLCTSRRAFGTNTGDNGIRTRDLCVANATLSQLSYVPATIR